MAFVTRPGVISLVCSAVMSSKWLVLQLESGCTWAGMAFWREFHHPLGLENILTSPTLRYIVTITIGPAFFSASIYLCLARIVAVYGQRYSRFSPRTYTITFMLFDFVALVLQAAGGSMLGSDDRDTLSVGIKVMKAGLAAHLAAISIFTILATEIAFRVAYRQDRWNHKFSQLQKSRKFKAFLICKFPTPGSEGY